MDKFWTGVVLIIIANAIMMIPNIRRRYDEVDWVLLVIAILVGVTGIGVILIR